MIIGYRGESFDEKTTRHIKEIVATIVVCNNELQRAIYRSDINNESYYRTMISIYMNTLCGLFKSCCIE